jgi:OOP family OmpA-OmpF porin
VLPEAISIRVEQDRQLASALSPTVERILQESVEKDPESLARVLFPIMGPLIRKSIAAALRNMAESLNRTLEHSLSPQSLQWRLESWRTGRPFSEIVMLHSVQYRIEEIFLFHRETGLMLAHVMAEDVESRDPALVSAMLTAIEDFAKDSFSVKKADILEEFRVGDLTVWVEEGPLALIAAAVRGDAPESIRDDLQAVLERIHAEQARPLQDLPDDTGVFSVTEPHLRACLQTKLKEESRRLSPAIWVSALIVTVLLASWAFLAVRERWRWNDFLAGLDQAPGIVVTNAEKKAGNYYLQGLRDPLSVQPPELARQAGLDAGKLVQNWEPYHALIPDFVAARARQALKPPDTVTLEVEGTVLRARGQAPIRWIAEAEMLARVLPGVTAFDRSGLVDSVGEPGRTISGSTPDVSSQEIENTQLLFAPNSAQLAAGELAKLDSLRGHLRALNDWATGSGQTVRVTIVGCTDAKGSVETNEKLGRARARTVYDLLSSESPTLSGLQYVMEARPASSAEPNQEDELLRCVFLRIEGQETSTRQ